MDFELFEEIYAAVCRFVYAVLEIFGIKRDENGNLVK